MMIDTLLCFDRVLPTNVINDIHVTWTLKGKGKQTSYQLSFYDETNALIKQIKKKSNDQFCFTPLELQENKKYRYELIINSDIKNKKTGFFVSGLVNGFSKNAKWISDGKHFDIDNKDVGSKALYLRKIINVKDRASLAVLHLCGLGLYELRINNIKVGDSVLDNAFTDYRKTVLYSSYLVNDYLRDGDNVVEVILGDGWINQTTIDTWDFYKAPWRNDPMLLLELIIGKEKFYSDESWEVSYGEIVSNAIRCGEVHDFNAKTQYFPVKVVKGPEGLLKPSYLPPIKECEIIKPQKTTALKDICIYDFGKNMSGYSKIILKGKKGEKVNIIYSDRIDEEGCDNKSNAQYIFNPDFIYQCDSCILSGNIDEYKPLFVYHGFRYIAVSNNCEIKNIEAYFVHTDLTRGGYFKSNNRVLNKLYNMSVQSILSNYHGFPTDCPHREKNGWTGDAQLSLETSIYTFDMYEAYKKYVRDIIDSQLDTGQISCIVPTGTWGYSWGWGPAWDVAFFRISNAILDIYNDESFIKEVYPSLVRYFEFILTYSKDYLFDVGLGDWNYPKNIKFKLAPVELTSSCYVLYMSQVLTKFASLFDESRVDYYQAIENKIKSAIIKKYQNDKSLTGMAALTYFGIVDKSSDVLSYLRKHHYSIDMGILGVKFVFDILSKMGKVEYGIKILERKEYPSFRFWIEKGQTTLCEDFQLENSLNHHMFSPIAEFMIRGIAGVNILKNGDIELKPHLANNVNKVSLSINTIKGKYIIKTTLKGKKTLVNVKVPANGNVVYKNNFYDNDLKEF